MQSLDELLDLAFAMLRRDGVPEPPGGYDSGHLKAYLKKNKLHLPELCKNKFSLLPPDVAVTYMWNTTTRRPRRPAPQARRPLPRRQGPRLDRRLLQRPAVGSGPPAALRRGRRRRASRGGIV